MDEQRMKARQAKAGLNPGPGAYVTALENTVGRTPLQPNGAPPGFEAIWTAADVGRSYHT